MVHCFYILKQVDVKTIYSNAKWCFEKSNIFQSLYHQSGSLVHVKWLLQKEKHIHSIFASKFLITKVTIMEFKKGGLKIFAWSKGGATDFSFTKRGSQIFRFYAQLFHSPHTSYKCAFPNKGGRGITSEKFEKSRRKLVLLYPAFWVHFVHHKKKSLKKRKSTYRKALFQSTGIAKFCKFIWLGSSQIVRWWLKYIVIFPVPS